MKYVLGLCIGYVKAKFEFEDEQEMADMIAKMSESYIKEHNGDELSFEVTPKEESYE